jgi:hypothetical protein
MAKDETKRSAEVARARAYARYTINLQRAFNDLLPKLKRAYGQPAGDATKLRSQHVLALLAISNFLARVAPTGDLAHFADQFAKLAQVLQDLQAGIRAPILTPAFTNRSDQTLVWLARAHIALAVETMRRRGGSRKSAAQWAARKHPGLKKLITERGPDPKRGGSLEKAIISWCEDFISRRVKNHFATCIYSEGLSRLEAGAPNCNSDQMKDEADRLLQKAIDPASI